MATSVEEGRSRTWTAAEFEDAVADMFRRLPGVTGVVRQSLVSPKDGGRPVTVDMVVTSRLSTRDPIALPSLLLVEVTGKRGGAAILADLERLRAAQAIAGGEGLIVAPWSASRETREIAASFQIWDREHLLDLAKQFPDALAPVLPFLDKAKPEAGPVGPSSSLPPSPPPPGPETAGYDPRYQPTISVERTDKGWRLPCDAYVLRLGPRGSLEGPTWEAFSEDTQGAVDPEIIMGLKGHTLTPSRPLMCRVAAPGLANFLILATAYRSDGVNRHVDAIRGVIKAAADAGLSSIALPLIGASEVEATGILHSIGAVVSSTRLARPLRITVVVETVEEEAAARQILLDQPSSGVSAPETIPGGGNYVPLIRADALGDGPVVDRLGVEGQARTFARLLAAESTPMPLAVGLFGNWGSGKSFFMTLIRQEMKNIATSNQNGGGYCTKVAHITFNAWHYVDSDLWASLALRIFDGVAAVLAEGGDDATRESREAEERRKLAEGTAASLRLKAELEALRVSRSEMESKVANVRKERQNKASSFEAADLLKALETVKDAACWTETKALLARFGVAEPKDLAELEKSLASVKGVAGSFGALLPGWMMGRSWLRRGALVLALLGLTFLVPLWGSASDALYSWIAVKLEPLGPLVASAVALAAWVAKRLETIKGVPARIEDLRRRLDAAKGALKREKSDECPLAALDQEIETLEGRIAEADQEVAAVTACLHRIESGALIYDFLQERAADHQYLGRTGIIAVLREDLRRLEVQLKALDPQKAKVQRIVLYIDDLDRCEPDRVVDVLQAVHLLLAFELFAVVVAVDARWLERSLYRRYLDGDGTMSDDEREAGDFSPQNYLEKIFQIPYRIPAIGKDPFGELVSSLVTPETDQSENKNLPVPEDDRKTVTPDPLGDDQVKDDGAVVSEWTDTPVDSVGPDNRAEEQVTQPPMPPPEKPPYLELLPEEIDAIKRLHRFVPTPRAVKRLINVYVMIRMQLDAEASGSQDKLKNGGAWELILLLGIDIGFPRASQMLRHVLEEEGTELAGWEALLERMKALCPSDRPHLREQMERLTEALGTLKVRPDVTEVRSWLPHVDRFSFHSPALPE